MRHARVQIQEKLKENLVEALQAVSCCPLWPSCWCSAFTIAPLPRRACCCAFCWARCIVVGMMFFTLGAEMSMTPMGERVGSPCSPKAAAAGDLGVGFLLGFIITISEPDLQVLANQVPSIPNLVLILSVAAGVGLFLVIACCVCCWASRCRRCWCSSTAWCSCWPPLCPGISGRGL